MEEMSPADRLFGWVAPKGQGAWRGRLRVGAVTMSHPDKDGPHEQFKRPIPLAILGAPKPAQARFYLGGQDGHAQRKGLDKRSVGYSAGRQLRGRKVYWTPRGVVGNTAYWESPWEDRTNRDTDGYYQEYRQPGKKEETEKTKQNRSIKRWIKPGAEIRFSVKVENLALEELGCLLRIASLKDWAGKGAVLRIGMGKPLGLGCVKLELDPPSEGASVGRGQCWAKYYAKLSDPEPAFRMDDGDINAAQEAFGTAISTVYGREGQAWTDIPFVKAFAAAALGPQDNWPVRYPRKQGFRTAGGDVTPSYEWFVENEKKTRDKPLPGFCLPNPWEDTGLPVWP